MGIFSDSGRILRPLSVVNSLKQVQALKGDQYDFPLARGNSLSLKLWLFYEKYFFYFPAFGCFKKIVNGKSMEIYKMIFYFQNIITYRHLDRKLYFLVLNSSACS